MIKSGGHEDIFLKICEYGNLEILKYFFSYENNINYNFKNKMNIFGRTKIDESGIGNGNAFHFVCDRGYYDMFNYLIDNVYNKCNKGKLLSMLTKELHNTYHDGYNTPLRAAIRMVGVTRYKLYWNENIDSTNGNIKIIHKMLSLGVDPNITEFDTSDSKKPLHHGRGRYRAYITDALEVENSLEILKLLLNDSGQFKHSIDWVCDPMSTNK